MRLPWGNRKEDKLRVEAEAEVQQALQASITAGRQSIDELQRAIGAFRLLTEIEAAEAALRNHG